MIRNFYLARGTLRYVAENSPKISWKRMDYSQTALKMCPNKPLGQAQPIAGTDQGFMFMEPVELGAGTDGRRDFAQTAPEKKIPAMDKSAESSDSSKPKLTLKDITPEDIKVLVQQGLQSGKAVDREKLWTTLNAFYKADEQIGAILATAGIAPHMVKYYAEGSDREQQIALLLLMTWSCDAHLAKAFTDAGAIPLMIRLLSKPSEDEQFQAVCILLQLTTQVSDNNIKIVKAGIAPPLVKLLRSEYKGMRSAVLTLMGQLASNPKTIPALVAAGAIPSLVEQMKKASPTDREIMMETLYDLLATEKARAEVVASEALPIIIDTLKNPVDIDERFTSSALRVLMGDEGAYVSRIVDAGAIPALVPLLISERASSIPIVQENAMVILSGLCYTPEYQDLVLASGAVPHIAKALGNMEGDAAEMSLTAMCGLLEVNSKIAVDSLISAGLVDSLVHLLRYPKQEEVILEKATRSLQFIAREGRHTHPPLFLGGAIRTVLGLFPVNAASARAFGVASTAATSKDTLHNAITLLHTLMYNPTGRSEMLHYDIIPALLSLFPANSGTSSIIEEACTMLKTLTESDEEATKALCSREGLDALVRQLGVGSTSSCGNVAVVLSRIAELSSEHALLVEASGAVSRLESIIQVEGDSLNSAKILTTAAAEHALSVITKRE